MRLLPAVIALVASLALAPAAIAKPRVEWSAISVRSGPDEQRVAKMLKKMLVEATRRAEWGKGKEPLRLRATLVSLDFEQRAEVLHVTVAMRARIEGGSSASSRLRFGGHPRDRRKLERNTLRIVAEGLVTRLAELARKQSERAEREAEAAEDEADDADQ